MRYKVLSILLFALLVNIVWTSAEIPHQINYQGHLTDDLGMPLSGEYDFTFGLYDAEFDGEELWTEAHENVMVSEGIFHVLLGSVNPVELDFSGAYWLEVEIEGETLNPRLEFTSVGQAYRSEEAEDVYYRDINPKSVTIADYGLVIDETGQWLGDPTGLTGPTGPQGETGPAGPQGDTGPIGLQGDTGLTGPQGETGSMGAQGDTGPPGLQGDTGLTGPQGETGLVGPQGDTGTQGFQGDTGLTGPQGDTGLQGPQGDTGLTGQQGDTGPMGAQGDTGMLGPMGFTGPIGPQGNTGPQGLHGNTGPVGPQGDTGMTGPMGFTGPIGPQGNTGPQGPQGDTGLVGPQGDTGMLGPMGFTGPVGPQGSTGPMGPQGDTGPMGVQGDAGPTGPIGPQGDTGPEGPYGPQGDTGPTGPQGDTGPVAGMNGQLIYNDEGSASGSEVYYDKATGNVGIHTSSPAADLHLYGTNPVITFEDDSDGDNGVWMHLQKTSDSPAANDRLGRIRFYGNNDSAAPALTQYAFIEGYTSDVTEGDEAGKMYLSTSLAGSTSNMLCLDGARYGVGEGLASFNNSLHDVDFQVCWDGGYNALYIDGETGYTGLGTNSPKGRLDVSGLLYIGRQFADYTSRTIYVSLTGDDTTGDGSSGNPYLTINRALNDIPTVLNYSVTIQFEDGTYYLTTDPVLAGRCGSRGRIYIRGNSSDNSAVELNMNTRLFYINDNDPQIYFQNMTITSGTNHPWNINSQRNRYINIQNCIFIKTMDQANWHSIMSFVDDVFVRVDAEVISQGTHGGYGGLIRFKGVTNGSVVGSVTRTGEQMGIAVTIYDGSNVSVGADITNFNKGIFIGRDHYNCEGPATAILTSNAVISDCYYGAYITRMGFLNTCSGNFSNNTFDIYRYMGASDDDLSIAGSVAIGTHDPGSYNLYVSGTAYCTTSWQTSDARFKSEVAPISNALEKVTKMQGIEYLWNADQYPDYRFDRNRNIGLIAQDVESVLPEIVHTGEDGYKSISYDMLTAVLVEAIKELEEKNELLQAQIDEMKGR